jgi:hypothetical protein
MSSDHEAEIRASVGAHADLGPDYDDGVAEGLVERIGAEIDKRIDARLGQFGATGAPGPAPGSPGPAGPAPGLQGPAAPAGAQPGAPLPAGALPVNTGPVNTGPVNTGPVNTGPANTGPATMGPVSMGPAGAMPAGTVPGLPGVHPPPAGYPGYQGYPGYLGPVLPPGYQLGPPPARPSEVGARNVATTIIALGSMTLGVIATAIVAHAASLGGQGAVIFLIWVAIAVVNVVHARRP